MKRMLRLAVYRGGKLVDDRHVARKGTVTAGRALRNTLLLPDPRSPVSRELVRFERGEAVLLVTPEMTGLLALDGRTPEPLLPLLGQAQADGDTRALSLPETTRGWVSLGDATVLLSFEPRPAPPPRRVLPRSVRTGIWSALATPVAGIGLAVAVVEGACIHAIHRRPLVEVEMPVVDVLDRFPTIPMPRMLEIPRRPEPAVVRLPSARPLAPPTRASPPATEDEAARRGRLRRELSDAGLLRVIGAASASGPLANLFKRDSELGRDIASVRNVEPRVADTGLVRKTGPAGPDTVAIGGLEETVRGGADVRLRPVRAVEPQLVFDPEEMDTTQCPQLDRESLRGYVGQRLRGIQACYERELKRAPGLAGRMVVRFVITTAGRVADVSIDEDTLGNADVAACVRDRVAGWRFPSVAEDSPVTFPFVFQPGG